ncbi:helix-turn-helix domain-containing protein [Streptomyces zhihengii]
MSAEGLPEVSELAAELAALRDKAGISGNRLADRTGHDASNISRYWKGERHPTGVRASSRSGPKRTIA